MLSPVFFTDRNLGKKFPEILRSAGLTVERHADHFEHDTPDEVWLRDVGQKGWIVVTHDARIRYKPNELQAVLFYRVALLVVVGKVPHPELAHAFVATSPRILSFIGRHSPPYVAKVYRGTHVGDAAAFSFSPGRIELSL